MLLLFVSSSFVPVGDPALYKTVRLAAPAAAPAAAKQQQQTIKRRTLREILGRFMQVPFSAVVAAKM